LNTADGTFQWNLKDRSGTPAANGLYYLRVEVADGKEKIQKTFKVLLI
jgi:hypothetical protein